MNDSFLDERHRSLAQKAKAFGDRHLRSRAADESDPIGQTREVLLLLSDARLLEHCVPPPHGMMDVRSLVTVREQLAYFSGIADTAFAMQGLGSHAISLAGSEALQKRWLPPVMGGELPAAFALTEPEAGSDLASLRTRAERDGAAWRLTGVKTLISNAGIAGFYTVLARSSKEEGHAALSMFLVDAHSSGISFKPIELIAPHPIGEVHFESTPAVLVGGEGQGYKLSLATLDAFRPSVGAAACGMAAPRARGGGSLGAGPTPVRAAAVGASERPARHRRHARGAEGGAADGAPGGLGERQRRRADYPRGRLRQADRHRDGAARSRSRAPDSRGTRRREGHDRRAFVPRGACLADL